MSGKVFCKGCAFLMRIEGESPKCLATIRYVDGPLRRRIDMVDRANAERRNIFNDCIYRRRFSFKAMRGKRWILWRLNYNGSTKENTLKGIGIKDYSIVLEEAHTKKFLKEARGKTKNIPYKEANLLYAGGIGSSDDAKSSDGDEGDQGIFDFELDDGQSGADIHEGKSGSDD